MNKKVDVKKFYHSNGNISSEIPLINNKINGMAKYYNKNNKLVYKISFKNDKIKGTNKWYYKGKLMWVFYCEENKIFFL